MITTEVRVKCTLAQALRFCTGRTAQRGSRSIALPFLDHGTRRGLEVSVTQRPLFTPGKTRYPLYRRLGGPHGRSGQVPKISPPTEIRFPACPGRSQSLYRLRYPAHTVTTGTTLLSRWKHLAILQVSIKTGCCMAWTIPTTNFQDPVLNHVIVLLSVSQFVRTITSSTHHTWYTLPSYTKFAYYHNSHYRARLLTIKYNNRRTKHTLH